MGLLTRLRSHERSRSHDPKSSPDPSQVLHSASSSGGSDFSFMSSSSQSSVDKGKPFELSMKEAGVQRRQSRRVSNQNNRHSMPTVSSSPLRQTHPAGKGPKNGMQGFHNNSMQNIGQSFGQTNSMQNLGDYAYSNDGSYAYDSNGTGYPSQRTPTETMNTVRPPNRILSKRVASGLSTSSFEVSSADISGVSGNSGSSSDYEEENETLQESHPYYKQWKEYYEALERQKLDPTVVVAQQVSQLQSSTQFQSQPHLSISPEFLNQAKSKKVSDNLVLNSRKSTVKSNRSASVPSFGHAAANPHSRSVSINASSTGEPVTSATTSNFTIDGGLYEQEQTGDAVRKESPITKSNSMSPVRDDTSASPTRNGENASPVRIGQEPRRDVSQISDYAAYIFYDDEKDPELNTPATQNVSPQKPSPQYAVSQSASPHNVNSQSASPQNVSPQNEMSRQSSTASASSYNSLQSEKQFSVGRHPSRIATPSNNPKIPKRKPSFSPPLTGPPPPIYPNMYNGAHHSTTSFSDFNRHSMMGMPMNNAYMQQMQQQLIQQMQHMQHLNTGQYQGQFNAPKTAISSDSKINARIQEFTALRQAIASGNKSLEFRLQWLKMLVCAVNYKLFSYINIKGEPISQEQISPNKQFFIKSVQTHLQKLLRELNNDRVKNKEKIFGEICFIQGCLYSQAYAERYYQDFGYDRNDEEAERFFHLAIDYDPLCFKAFYELGELYESQDLEDKFDLALENYKESAKLGYNRAIYKVALIYLIVPKVRSIKYFRYFKNLADIDMESREIQLSGIDLEELEQVVGLAQFQLGKIYEGIYPGDLTIEDQFVVESLELAPVNYSKSLSYYNRAAKLSCLQAQVKLGHIYEQGELNRPHNAVKSIQWYIKAATSPLKFKRHAEAMLGISRWFMRGTESESKHIPFKDTQMAVQWCERACKEFGSAEAFYQMGLYVEEGLSLGDAKSYFQEAAEMGHELAMQKLGEQYPGQV